jgi:branched-subunit amino acid transport protein
MDYTRIFICIAIMALVTYLPRMLPLAIFRRKIENQWIRSFLHYVPYAVLAAMTFPEILYSTGTLTSGIVGLVVAVVLSLLHRGLLTVAVGASAAVFLTEQILSWTGILA